MGWKGTLRSVNSSLKRAAREAERESKKRQRELERQQKELAKLEAQAQAAYEVEVYENLIERLTTVHKESVDEYDWHGIAGEAPPVQPVKSDELKLKAEKAYSDYKPSFFDKLLKREEKKVESLKLKISKAGDKDESTYQKALRRYEAKHREWDERTAFARRIESEDISAFNEAIQELGLFEEIQEFGSRVTVQVLNARNVDAELHVHGEDIIPKEKKVLLQSGKLSLKKMPKGEFYEHFQDHVCSGALRIANELFGALPLEMVTVTALDTMLNSSTGHLEEQPILSVKIPRASLEKLNLDYIDASDSMGNFVHKMDFKKTKGFAAVERLTSPLEPPPLPKS